MDNLNLQEFGKNIWIADGPNVKDMCVMFTTRMVIVKLSDNSIWINSPVSVSYETLKKICGLGEIKYLVAATPRHVWCLYDWHILFPEAQTWLPKQTVLTLKRR